MYQRPLTRPVAEVLASPVAGNAYSDHDLWRELYRIALNVSNPIEVRARAVRKMDELTGCPESAGKDDNTAVVDFCTGMAEQCGVPTFASGEDR
jgi:hypothetical protein